MCVDKVLYLMRGIPASGKSTVAQMIANATNGVICSTDDFWYDENDIYNFDPKMASYAHLMNQKKVIEHMTDSQESIIVDNTNIDMAANDALFQARCPV
jgi:uridine kinase